ncbi:chemotaxis protein MotB [Paenibacillus sp. UNCCL117]|uniref:flagellar motor protein MotB n=1 Tax=unclassified Paenibacillus TaxID=185978 RepID=UPI000882C585|nr:MULTISPECIES: flagellar motor protein MotB [unclassified Paenibacillus]SDE50928.1 chemotaxis protein MotB [Paenibacillus sp. cl123]SFW67251.1 chemotaxis protein MotB [Paenibacillus sp. UNCCL117]
MARRIRRRQKAADGGNHERWLITYSDLITLLLIFFIIMYAMSKIDVQKYEVLAQALKFEFTKADSIVPQGQGITGSMHPPGTPAPDTQDPDQEQRNAELKREKEQQLEDLLEQVQAYVQENNLQAQVSAADTQRGVAVTLNDLFLFDLGKADLKQEAIPILTQLATLFRKLDSTVSIEGHTDDLPLSTGSVYKDNWGLSQARSLSVLRYFIYDAQVDAKKFISTSYADTRPVAENNSEENRARNRRVEIVVLR